MNLGCDKAPYVLPFDHRQSYVTDMFHSEPPLDATQRDQVIDSKQLIHEGFRQALAEGVPFDAAGILVDEQFGAAILRDARQRGLVTAVSVEQLGSLKQLSGYCRRSQRSFKFELLVSATDDQLARAGGDKNSFDRQARPLLMQQTLHAVQGAGIEPDVSKVEGLDSQADGELMVQIARRGERDQVCCIVLGCGADEARVRARLAVAAGVPGFIGFAVGRTSFWDAVAGYRAQTLTRFKAATQTAGRLREWVDVFEAGRSSQPGGTA